MCQKMYNSILLICNNQSWILSLKQGPRPIHDTHKNDRDMELRLKKCVVKDPLTEEIFGAIFIGVK